MQKVMGHGKGNLIHGLGDIVAVDDFLGITVDESGKGSAGPIIETVIFNGNRIIPAVYIGSVLGIEISYRIDDALRLEGCGA